MAVERWKPVKGYEGLYDVSDAGRVRSLKRTTTNGRILTLHTSQQNGYVYATLCKNGVKRSKRVHRLVMTAFAPDTEKPQINHKDGNKTNNALCNLEWCTGKENMAHAYATGLEKAPTRNVIDLTTGKIYESVTDAAVSLDGRTSAVSKVCKGIRSQYKNHVLAYYDDFIHDTVPVFRGKFKKRSSENLWVNHKG